MKSKKENIVSEKNMYFCVTVFLVQLVLAVITFVMIGFLKHFLIHNISTEAFYFVMTPIELALNFLIWYIAGRVGVYNIFNSQKIAKKNLLPLRKAVIKDWCFFIGMMILLSLSNTLNIMIVGISLIINLPLLKRNFDRQAALLYHNISFE